MAAHPGPDFSRFKLTMLSRQTLWYRIHESRHGAVYFGQKRCRGRFDDPLRRYGVLYAGADELCAFVETFGHDTGRNLVRAAQLNATALAVLRFRRPLRLADLRNARLARLGADSRLFADADYAVPQRWSRAIFEHPSKPDGILYNARHDPAKVCVALFDRAGRGNKKTIVVSQSIPLDPVLQGRRIGKWLNYYNFGFM